MATLFRRNEEVEEWQRDKTKALEVGGSSHQGPVELQEEDNYVMLVGEERKRIQPHALEEPPVQHLIKTLIKWVNEVLEERRIIIRHLAEDFYDGQVLSELYEELTGQKFLTAGVTMSIVLQKAKLKTVLDKINRLLHVSADESDHKWTIELIYSKDIVAILHLLVALASYFRCKHPIPQNVKIKRIYLKQHENRLETKLYEEEITGYEYRPRVPEEAGSTERDVFDKLFAEAPEKLEAVKRSLCQFANKVLLELDININDIGSQFHNGVNFILMMGLLEGYFIPLHLYHYNPTTVDNKIDNVRLAFKLMSSCGLDQTKVNPQDVVERDLKSILRVLYSIFQKYKSKIQQTPSTAGQGPRPT